MSTKVNSHEPNELISYSIEMRIAILIQTVLNGKNDWKKLEDLTGIKSVKWRHFNAGVIKPSLEMVEKLCKEFPQYAFWLSTGLTDYDAGHLAPQINVAFPGSIKGKVEILPSDHVATISFFKQSLKALDICWNGFRNVWFDDLQPQDWSQAAEVFKKEINASIQLGASEMRTALGAQEQKTLLTQLAKNKEFHIYEMILRMRHHREVDKIIDEQRKFELDQIEDIDEKGLKE